MLDRDPRQSFNRSLTHPGSSQLDLARRLARKRRDREHSATIALFFPQSSGAFPASEKDLIAEDRLTVTRRKFAQITPRGYPLKRMLDIVGSLALLVLFGPLMIIVATLLACFQGRPLLFSQERIGLGGETFRILKFRTMRTDAGDALSQILAQDNELSREWSENQKMMRDPRVTWLGRLLRVSSIDELPQLLNVLKGDMSLVGPRPIVADEVARYGRQFQRYCAMKPGLTGLWQVCRSRTMTYRRRVAIDVVYGRKLGLGLDLLILLRTIPAVLLGRGH